MAELTEMEGYDEVVERFLASLPPEQRLAGLAPELEHEPRAALSPGGDGLGAYRRIAAGSGCGSSSGGMSPPLSWSRTSCQGWGVSLSLISQRAWSKRTWPFCFLGPWQSRQ